MTQAIVSDFSALKPEIYGPMAQTMLAQYVDFMLAGAADRIALPPGEFVPFAGFKELSGDLDIMSDDGEYDINKIDPKKDISVVLHRIKNFGADDLVKIITGLDPMTEIARQLANYFGKKISASFLSVLKGAFASAGPLYATNLYSVYVDTATVADRVNMSPAVAAAGMQKLGDEFNNLKAWFMHSKVVSDLLAAGYISTTTATNKPYGIDANGEIMSFMGKPIIMKDTLLTTAGSNCTSYRTYGVGMGALGYGVQKDLNPENSRNSEKKMDVISTDIHFSAHIRGVKWNVTTANPTAAQLETATNWALAEESAKFVRVVAIETN